MKITKVYTRTGDKGTTSLVGGERIAKDSVRLESYGTIDELNSHLGLLVAMLSATDDVQATIATTLQRIQCCLFNIGTYLATDTSTTPIYASAKLSPEETEFLEQQIDSITSELPPLNGFILPGGSTAAAQCHVCRTVCRRAERIIVALSHETELRTEYVCYVNRLSDFLFVLARKLNYISNIEEKIWQNPCN